MAGYKGLGCACETIFLPDVRSHCSFDSMPSSSSTLTFFFVSQPRTSFLTHLPLPFGVLLACALWTTHEQIRAANTPADAAADFAAAGSEVTVKRHDLGDCKVRLEVTVPISVQERAYIACMEAGR